MKYYAYAMCLAVCGAADAHHGPGQFDRSQPMEVTGVVTDIRFVNPHGYVYFDVTDANGGTVPWRCELQAGSLLRRSGWTEDLFGIGGTITVTGDQGRREEHACALRSVILADGSVLDRYGQRREVVAPPTRPLRLADGQLNLAGAWAAVQRRPAGGTGLDDAGPGRGPEMIPGPGFELTAAGRKAIEGVSHQVDNPRFYCMPVNIFFDWTFDRHINEIIQTEETITLKYGFMDIVRTIHMNLEEHPVELTPAGRSDPLFDSMPPRFAAHMGHHDYVSELPSGAIELAVSETCPAQAFRIEGTPVYGTQFHCELNTHRLLERLRIYRHIYQPADDDLEELEQEPVATPQADIILRRFIETCVQSR